MSRWEKSGKCLTSSRHPKDLVLKDETVKVTISLSKASVEFFKEEARKHKTQYQRMIRRLLDEYTAHHIVMQYKTKRYTVFLPNHQKTA